MIKTTRTKRILSMLLIMSVIVTSFLPMSKVQAEGTSVSLETFSGKASEWGNISHDTIIRSSTLTSMKAVQVGSTLYLSVSGTGFENGDSTFYIDSDKDSTTGASIANWIDSTGIDYKIVNTRLYKYNAGNWDQVENVTVQMSKNDTVVEASINIIDLGLTASKPLKVAFYKDGASSLPEASNNMMLVNEAEVITAGQSITNLVVDGSNSEWTGITPLLTTAAGTTTASAIICDNKLDVLIEGQIAAAEFGSFWEFLYIDTDKNAATGNKPWMWNNIGAEYAVQTGILYKGDGNGSWSAQTASTLSCKTSGTGANKIIEWSIPLSDLGISSEKSMNISLYGDGDANNRSTSVETVYPANPDPGPQITVDGTIDDWAAVGNIVNASGVTSELYAVQDGKRLYTLVKGNNLNTRNVYYINSDNDSQTGYTIGGLWNTSTTSAGIDFVVDSSKLYELTGNDIANKTLVGDVFTYYTDTAVEMYLDLSQIGVTTSGEMKIGYIGKGSLDIPSVSSDMATISNSIVREALADTYYPNEYYGILNNPYTGWVPWANSSAEKIADNTDYTQPHSLVYAGASWKELEPTEGIYDWAAIESKYQFDFWATQGSKINLRIVLDTPTAEVHRDIPDWLYTKINGDGTQYDVSVGKGFSPNYSNETLIAAHKKLIEAIAAKYKDDPRIGYIQLGSLGHWGEWHCWPYTPSSGVFPTKAISDIYVQQYIDAFGDAKKLTMRRGYELANNNIFGLFNDMFGEFASLTSEGWGWLDQIQKGYTDDIGQLHAPMPDFWKYGPSGGEFANGNSLLYLTDETIMSSLNQARLSHTSWLGPCCPAVYGGGELQGNIDALQKTMGYRFIIESATHNGTVNAGETLPISIKVNNKGIAPFYFNWPLTISLFDSLGKIVTEVTTNEDIRTWLPGRTTINTEIAMPENIANGDYTICVSIVDPDTGLPGVNFANTGKRSDGRYTLDTVQAKAATVVDAGTQQELLDAVAANNQVNLTSDITISGNVTLDSSINLTINTGLNKIIIPSAASMTIGDKITIRGNGSGQGVISAAGTLIVNGGNITSTSSTPNSYPLIISGTARITGNAIINSADAGILADGGVVILTGTTAILAANNQLGMTNNGKYYDFRETSISVDPIPEEYKTGAVTLGKIGTGTNSAVGWEICYTTDGSDPTTSNTAQLYTSPIELGSTIKTIKAVPKKDTYYGDAFEFVYDRSVSTQEELLAAVSAGKNVILSANIIISGNLTLSSATPVKIDTNSYGLTVGLDDTLTVGNNIAVEGIGAPNYVVKVAAGGNVNVEGGSIAATGTGGSTYVLHNTAGTINISGNSVISSKGRGIYLAPGGIAYVSGNANVSAAARDFHISGGIAVVKGNATVTSTTDHFYISAGNGKIYDFRPATITTNPASEDYTSGPITLSKAADGANAATLADIFYTTDGSNPETSSTASKYTDSIYLSETAQIKAVAMKDGYFGTVSEFIFGVGTLTINNPYKDIDWSTVKQVKAALHNHTINTNKPIGEWSDGVAGTVAERVANYKSLGFGIMAITEHDYVSYPWSDYGVSEDPDMISIQGNELSKNAHMLSYFNGYYDHKGEGSTVTSGFEANIQAVGELGGMMYIAHPARAGGATTDINYDVSLFQKYPHIKGMEVINAGQFTNNFSENIWDGVLTALMPTRNVWGDASDDAHSVFDRNGNGFTYVLLDPSVMLKSELEKEAAVRDALENGKTYFSSWCIVPGQDDAKTYPGVDAPKISNITVNESDGTITLAVTGADTIEWISATGKKVATGNSINVRKTIGVDKYVRARMYGTGGQTMTQPFGIVPSAQLDRIDLTTSDQLKMDISDTVAKIDLQYKGYMNDTSNTDLASATSIKFDTNRKDLLDISQSGTVTIKTGATSGFARVWVNVIMDGILVKSNELLITVTNNANPDDILTMQVSTFDELSLAITNMTDKTKQNAIQLMNNIDMTGAIEVTGNVKIKADVTKTLTMASNVINVAAGAILTVEGVDIVKASTESGSIIALANGSVLNVYGSNILSANAKYTINGGALGGDIVNINLKNSKVTTNGGRAIYCTTSTSLVNVEDSTIEAKTGSALYRGSYSLSGTTVITGTNGGSAAVYDFRDISITATPETNSIMGSGETVELTGVGSGTGNTAGYSMVYTIDGSDPRTSNSTNYTLPFAPTSTSTVVKAAPKAGVAYGKVFEFTYTLSATSGDIGSLALTPANNLTEGNNNVIAGANVGTFTATGGDGSGYVYTLEQDETKGPDNNKFAIDGANLMVGATALLQGNYTINVKVLNGTKYKIQQFIVTVETSSVLPSAITITAAKTDVTSYNGSDGTITVTTSGSGIAVEYSIDGLVWQASNNFTGLKAGTYTVKAREKGNTTNESNVVNVVIGQPAKVVTTPNTTTNPTTNTQQQVTSELAKITVRPVIDGKIATATIDMASLAKAVDNSASVVIEVVKADGVNAYETKLPTAALSSGNAKQKIEVVTDLGSIVTSANMLSASEVSGASNVSLAISKVDTADLSDALKNQIGNRPVIEINLKVDGVNKAWSNPDAPVTITIPYTPTASELLDTEHIVVWYLDGVGNVLAVPSGRYNAKTGKVTFTTTHFSKYAVAYVKKTFDDIDKYAWAKNAIEVLASKGIVSGTAATNYTPSASVKRADFILMLVKALSLTAKADDNFADVKPGAYYADALAVAKKLGIAASIGDNKFNPEAPILRQDMMTLINKAMKVAEKTLAVGTSSELDKFTDKSSVAAYAQESVATLVKNGIVAGYGDTVNPLGNTTRAETAVLIYKMYNK